MGKSNGSARRSAQQVEYRTVQGQATESDRRRARERALLKLGLADPESMYLFPVGLARKAKIRFPELDEKQCLGPP